MVDFVNEKLMGLPHKLRARANETIESIRQASSDLLVHSRDYLAATDDSSSGALNEKITFTIKRLVKALRDTKSIFDDGVVR